MPNVSNGQWVNVMPIKSMPCPLTVYPKKYAHGFCFVVVIHWLIFPYPSGLLHWHCGNLTIAPVPAKQPWWIWINTSCEFIMNDCITTTKQSTTKPCAYFLGYTVCPSFLSMTIILTVCNMGVLSFSDSEFQLLVIFQCCEIMIHGNSNK